MLKQFTYAFNELNISSNDLAPLLGFGNEIPEPFPSYIDEALEAAPGLCSIKGGYYLTNTIEVDEKNALIKFGDKNFSPSKVVTTQLKKATQAALFICTAGEGLSRHAQDIATNKDPMLGFVFDILGSVTVEKAMDKIQSSLQKEIKKNELGLSDRYSPGYCDWNVKEQHILFSFFPDNFCGVQLSKSSLMHPIKSVSGIIGIGKGLHPKGYQCNWCNDQNCVYGKLKRQ